MPNLTWVDEHPMPDVTFADHGSIWLAMPHSKAGQAWLDEHLPEARIVWGDNVVIEPRYVDTIATAMVADGLDIAAEG